MRSIKHREQCVSSICKKKLRYGESNPGLEREKLISYL